MLDIDLTSEIEKPLGLDEKKVILPVGVGPPGAGVSRATKITGFPATGDGFEGVSVMLVLRRSDDKVMLPVEGLKFASPPYVAYTVAPDGIDELGVVICACEFETAALPREVPVGEDKLN